MTSSRQPTPPANPAPRRPSDVRRRHAADRRRTRRGVAAAALATFVVALGAVTFAGTPLPHSDSSTTSATSASAQTATPASSDTTATPSAAVSTGTS